MKSLPQIQSDNHAAELAAARAQRLGLNAPCPACRAAPGEPCYEASAPGMTGAFTHNARLGVRS